LSCLITILYIFFNNNLGNILKMQHIKILNVFNINLEIFVHFYIFISTYIFIVLLKYFNTNCANSYQFLKIKDQDFYIFINIPTNFI